MKKWYNWPEGFYQKSWFPWYKIVWNLLTAPLVYVTFAAFYVSLIIYNGLNEAERVRKGLF